MGPPSLPHRLLAINHKTLGSEDPGEHDPCSVSLSDCVFLEGRQQSPLWLTCSVPRKPRGDPRPSKKGTLPESIFSCLLWGSPHPRCSCRQTPSVLLSLGSSAPNPSSFLLRIALPPAGAGELSYLISPEVALTCYSTAAFYFCSILLRGESRV